MRCLFPACIVLFPILVVAALAQVVDVDVETRRQIDLLKRFKNFRQPDGPETLLNEHVKIWIRKGLDKLTDDRIEFLLVHKKVASAEDVRRAVVKVRAKWPNVPLRRKRLSLASVLALESLASAEVVEKSLAIVYSEARKQIKEETILLKKFLADHTYETRTVNEALGSALSKGLAADPRKFRAARAEVDRQMKKEIKRLQSCCVLPGSPVKQNDELHWMAKLYGPDFEERLRILGTIRISRRENEEEKKHLSDSELLEYDDDKRMTERLLKYFVDGRYPLKATKSLPELEGAMELAQSMAVVVNPVRYNQDLALRSLLANGDQYENWFFRCLPKIAVESLSPRTLETLMEFSDSPNEDFRTALIRLAHFRLDNVYSLDWALHAGIYQLYERRIRDYLLKHKLAISPVIDEAYNLADQGNDRIMADMLEPKIKKKKKSKISSFIASLCK